MPDCNSGDGFPKLHNNRATLHIHFFNRDTILMVVREEDHGRHWSVLLLLWGQRSVLFTISTITQRRHLWRNSTPMAQYYISPPVRWGPLDFIRFTSSFLFLFLPLPSSSFLFLPFPSASFRFLLLPSASFRSSFPLRRLVEYILIHNIFLINFRIK